MDPPPCVQNAMMKQDKKPFTYTPGGIDLSEIKSPRMARRIERNANYNGPPEQPRGMPQQPVGPLPPSAMAAMQPQMHVQVFPTGPPPPPPGPRAGPPPPPPPPANIPPPPPPPTQPLPTQKVITSENQVLERPDMTKIIPDNPMALLRKTGGPQPRSSFIDELYGQKSVKTPPVQQQQRWPQNTPQETSMYQPKVIERAQPSPPVQQEAPKYQPRVIERAQPSPPVQQEVSMYQPKVIERNQQPSHQLEPQMYQTKVIERNPSQEEQLKTSTAHLGSLYIPPVNQRSVTSPPLPKKDPQSPQNQSPSTPTLKEAPKPWQKQQKPTEEIPPWAKKEPVAPNLQSVMVQQPQMPQQQYRPPNQQQSAPNAVYVTQPLVFQHPGPPPNRQQPRVDAQGAIIIPVQIERRTPAKPATPATPVTPGNDRNLNRQQSWNNAPTQSNAFRVIQKITQTEGDANDDNSPVIEHGPRYPQQFQQTPPAEQMRKLKLTDGDRELMNRFKQEEEDPRYRGGIIPSRVFRILDESGVDDECLHNEVDPRYRGPAIPSKAFKLLQSMTDGTSDGANVSRGPATTNGNRTPQVRTIPIQIERDDQPKNYVPPSEQTVPEPKKYTGSSIPSRSFKILQAMTAPENCANANEVNENYDPSSYNQWGYDPNYPPPVPPYWPDYYYNYYYQNSKDTNDSSERDIRQTPVPFWGYYPPPSPYPWIQPESENGSTRNTPLPWAYYPPYYPPPATPSKEIEEDTNITNNQQNYPPPYPYPPYWDPYYYYYGYPPIYSPYPYYDTSECEEGAGYSSTDEMAYFTNKMKNETDEPERESSKTPKILIPEEFSHHKEIETESERDSSDSDSETEVETEEERFQTKRSQSSNGLQTIRSVKDIKVYEDEEANSDEEHVSEETEDSVIDDETIPHQLSVIYEESERSESRSVVSDSTTVAEKSDAEDDLEDEENSTAVSVKLPLKIKVEVKENEEITTVTVGESEMKIEEEEEEDTEDGDTFATFILKPPADKTTAETETEAVINDSDIKEIPNEEMKEEEDDEQDWWGILNKDEDDIPIRPKICLPKPQEVEEEIKSKEIVEEKKEDDVSSTSSSDSSSSKSSSTSKKEVIEVEDSSDSEESDKESNKEKESLSIKERIQALNNSINTRHEKLVEDSEEMKLSVKEKISAIESGSLQITNKTTSTKSSVKSFEEFSEEEGDSGVTSDMSRHISDNEEFPELRKMTRYQRAATHSRLFKLLQEVCEAEEDEEEEKKEEEAPRRDQLSLPLKINDGSLSSSGITSPGSPINDKLVTELVQSILQRKKGQIFRNVPKEKLQAAARRILMEEFDDFSTPDSSFLSPLRSTESSTPAQTPQEFYNDYKQYYDSWSDAERLYDENYDILPSKAFKLLQEHSGLNKTGAIAGLLAKCPKILSSKNVHQELLKLIAESSKSPSPEKSLEPSEVTTAS